MGESIQVSKRKYPQNREQVFLLTIILKLVYNVVSLYSMFVRGVGEKMQLWAVDGNTQGLTVVFMHPLHF